MNTFGTYFKRNKKAFTIIELIVVIAVIGILVLLAAPKFLNYTKKAQLARIQNDTKAASTVVDAELTVSDSLAKWGEPVDIDLETLKNEKKVYTIEGLLTEENIESGPYWKIDKSDFRSKLPGEFYANSGGMVYYVDTKSGSVEDNGGNQNGGNDGDVIMTISLVPSTSTNAFTNSYVFNRINDNDVASDINNNTDLEYTYVLQDGSEVKSVDGLQIRDVNTVKVSIAEGGVLERVQFNAVDHPNIESIVFGSLSTLISTRNLVLGNPPFFSNNLTTLDVSNLNTSNVTDMSRMFDICFNLTTLDVSNFDTSNVTDMDSMFSSSNLTTLDVSNFDTSNVTNMAYMFDYCSNLTTLDVSNFDTSNVTRMQRMFGKCENLTSLDVSNFDTSNVTNMYGMFSGCQNLTTLDVSNFNTSKVISMNGMFSSCKNLTTLDVSNFDTSNVTSMNWMFEDCDSLTTLDLSNFDTNNVTDMAGMFKNCKNLTTLDVSNFDTSNVTSILGMYQMFSGCESLTILDLSNFDTSNVPDMRNMFKDCTSLQTIYARTEADANNFRNSTGFPAQVQVIVK